MKLIIRSAGDTFTLKEGMQKGKIWIDNGQGEAGDFDQDELYMHIRDFFDRRF